MIESSTVALHQAVIDAALVIEYSARDLAGIISKTFMIINAVTVEELVHLFRNITICKPEEKPSSPEEPFSREVWNLEPITRMYFQIDREPP